MGDRLNPFRANIHAGLQFQLKFSEYGEETAKRDL